MSQDPRALTLQTLSQFLVAHEAAADTLRRIAEIACDAIPAAEIAGMSLLTDDGGPATPIYTHEASPAIDRGQYADGRGPCLDAWRQRRVVNVEDVEAAVETYPAFSRTALDHGVRSTLSLPLVAHDSGLGALNLYSTKRSGFRAVDERVGTEIAAAASVVLANASADARVRRQEEQLAEALQRRALIEQAKGVLMGKIDDLSPDEAFTLLARAAKQQEVTVREVARRVVEERDPTVAHA